MEVRDICDINNTDAELANNSEEYNTPQKENSTNMVALEKEDISGTYMGTYG